MGALRAIGGAGVLRAGGRSRFRLWKCLFEKQGDGEGTGEAWRNMGVDGDLVHQTIPDRLGLE